MTVNELKEKLDLKPLVEDDYDREVTDCYVGDLLSWVMGRAPADSAWLTVMGNINSIAVATLADCACILADCACIILVENAALDDNAREKADMHGVNILTTPMNSYKLAVEISKLI